MKYETRLAWVLGITFGFVFFDRNAVNFLMPFVASDLHLTKAAEHYDQSVPMLMQAGCALIGTVLPFSVTESPCH